MDILLKNIRIKTITLRLKLLKHRVAKINLLDSKLNAWFLLMHLIQYNFFLTLKTVEERKMSNYSLVWDNLRDHF